MKSHIEFVQTWGHAMANALTKYLGSVSFLAVYLIFIFGWLLVNLGFFSGLTPFDPYPLNWLMLVVQLSATLLSIIVLINQNRQGRDADIRQQIEFEVNVRAEHEITKILRMLDELHVRFGIDHDDRELEQMKEKTNIADIREEVEKVIKK